MSQADLAESFRKAVRFRTDLEPAEWARRHVRLYRSTDAQYFRPEYTPWCAEPMREVRNNENRVVCFTGPVGLGKSTMIEAMVCNILDGDPGPMLITGQTDEDIEDWAETGLWPTLRACEPLKAKLPRRRGTWRKRQLVMPRCPVHLTGANMAGLQSKSERWVIGDEAWMWKQGMIGEMLKRLHRRWNGRAVLMGQAGFVELDEDDQVVGDDFTLIHDQGEQREWSFRCLKCGMLQPYLLEQLVMPEDGPAAKRAGKAVYECAHCGKKHQDSVKVRRRMAETAQYQVIREAVIPGYVSFHMNALALWRSPWAEVALEYLLAKESESKGLSLAMQQFKQKQMAEPWNVNEVISRPDVAFYVPPEGREDLGSGEHYASGEKVEGEVIRFATIDCGRDHYWLGIRAWRADGSSLGIWYGRVSTEEMVKELCIARGVRPHHTYIDSGYDTGRIYDLCARFGWVAIKGDQVSGYQHPKKGGGKVVRLMSPRKTVLAPCGKRVPLIHLASDPMKDILARLRSGEAARWEVVRDIGEDWQKQIDSEEKEEFLNARTKQPTVTWVRRRKDNHAWDVEYYQVAAALIWRVFSV